MRTEFSRTVKAAASLRAGGRCEGCGCKLLSGHFHFDHVLADVLGGAATLDNCAVLCRACHGAKTASHDVPRIAKAKRQAAGHVGAKKARRPLPGSRASGIRKRMDGRVERWPT